MLMKALKDAYRHPISELSKLNQKELLRVILLVAVLLLGVLANVLNIDHL